MKERKIPINRTIGIVAIIVTIATILILEVTLDYLFFFCGLIFLFIFEIPDFLRYRKELNNDDVIQVKSNGWLPHWLNVGFATYWLFYNYVDSSLLIPSIVFYILYGILESMRKFRKTYFITNDGIKDLESRKLIDSSVITEIDIGENKLSIHTNKYRNDLELKSVDVVAPSWNQVVNLMEKLK